MSLTPRTPAGAIRAEQVGREVDVYGWVHRRRDLGGLIFIDLRDRSGIVQVKFAPANAQAHAVGGELRPESVIHVQGAGVYGHNGADDVALDAALIARQVPSRPVRVQWPTRPPQCCSAPLQAPDCSQ